MDPKEHGHDSLAGLRAEIQADEAAGKAEEEFRRILSNKTPEQAIELIKSRGMER